jgi:hypothetical protein
MAKVRVYVPAVIILISNEAYDNPSALAIVADMA